MQNPEFAQPGKKRIHAALAEAGIGSRRACEAMVAAGRVSVNGQPARVGQVVQAGDQILVDGRPVEASPRWHVYYMLNKPAGVISTAKDDRGRRTILDLVRVPERVYPVGRLDADSEGLVLLTDDGELAYRLTHPRYGVPRVYLVLASGQVTLKELGELKQGIALPEGDAMIVQRIRSGAILEQRASETLLRLVLNEGRKREIRRLLLALGHPVLWLRRVQIGSLQIGSLAPGQWRRLTTLEIAELQRTVGLASRGENVQAQVNSD
jgi:23S rRNA pseudouridine2605 synthase